MTWWRKKKPEVQAVEPMRVRRIGFGWVNHKRLEERRAKIAAELAEMYKCEDER